MDYVLYTNRKLLGESKITSYRQINAKLDKLVGEIEDKL